MLHQLNQMQKVVYQLYQLHQMQKVLYQLYQLYQLQMVLYQQHQLYQLQMVLYQLHQLLQYHVLDDSTEVAMKVLALKDQYPPAAQQGIDMLHRLGQHNDVVEVLLDDCQVTMWAANSSCPGNASSLSALTSSGTCSSEAAAGVPGRGLYLKE